MEVLIAVTLVSLVCYGFWAGVFWVGRQLFQGPGAERAGHCRRCANSLLPGQYRCQRCGAVNTQAGAATRQDLLAMQRQIRRMADEGRIDEETRQSLSRLVQAELKELSRRDAGEPARDRAVVMPAGPESAPAVERPAVRPVERSMETPAAVTAETAERPVVSEADPWDEIIAAQTPSHPVMPVADHGLPVMTSSETQETASDSSRAEPSDEPARQSPGSRRFAAFMEERNIQWGELISTVLIVVCSFGLVISLWSTLDSIPYFPALLFLLVTVAIHSAGLYTLKRWRLKSTSRGLVSISLLLVPLNFLAGIAISQRYPDRSFTDPLVLMAFFTALAVLGTTTWSGARVLSRPVAWWPLWLVCLGPAVSQVLIHRQASANVEGTTLLTLSAVPVGCFAFGLIVRLIEATCWRRLTSRRAQQLLRTGATGAFSLIVALGLLAWKSGDLSRAASWMAPMICVAAATLLSSGLIVHQRLKSRGELQLTGTMVALLGGSFMVASVAAAWPHAGLLITTGLLSFLTLTLLAVVGRFPQLHVPAFESLALALVVGTHHRLGTIALDGTVLDSSGALMGSSRSALFHLLLLGRSAVVFWLTGMVAIAGAGLLQRLKRTEAAKSYGIAGGLLLVASTLAAGYACLRAGPGMDRDLASPVLIVNGLSVVAAALLTGVRGLASIGSILTAGGLLHLFLSNGQVQRFWQSLGVTPAHPAVTALLTHATLLTGLVVLLRAIRIRHGEREAGSESNAVRNETLAHALTTSLLLLPTAGFVPFNKDWLVPSGYFLWAALVWMTGCLVRPSAWKAGMAQGLGACSAVFFALSLPQWVPNQSELNRSALISSALALWSGLCLLVRRGIAHPALRPQGLVTVDRVQIGLAVLFVMIPAWIGTTALAHGGEFLFLGLEIPALCWAISTWPVANRPLSNAEADRAWPVWRTLSLISLLFFIGLWKEIRHAPDLLEPFTSPVGAILFFILLGTLLMHLRDRMLAVSWAGLFAVLTGLPLVVAGLPETLDLSFRLAIPETVAIGLALMTLSAALAGCMLERRSLLREARETGQIGGPVLLFLAVPAVGLALARTAFICGHQSEFSAAWRDQSWNTWQQYGAVPLLVPLLIAVAGLVNGMQRRCGRTLLSAGLIWLVAVMADHAVSESAGLMWFEVRGLTGRIQLVALAGLAWAALWTALDYWRSLDGEPKSERDPSELAPSARLSFAIQESAVQQFLSLTRFACWWPGVIAFLRIVTGPGWLDVASFHIELGVTCSLCAVVLTFAQRQPLEAHRLVRTLTLALLTTVSLLAASVLKESSTPDREVLAQHLLSGGWLLTALLLAGLSEICRRESERVDPGASESGSASVFRRWMPSLEEPLAQWSHVIAGILSLVVLVPQISVPLSIRLSDPWWPYWPAALMTGVAVATGVTGLSGRSLARAYGSTLALLTAGWLCGAAPFAAREPALLSSQQAQAWLELQLMTVPALVISGLSWLVIGRKRQIRDPDEERLRLFGFTQQLATASVAILIALAGLALFGSSFTLRDTLVAADVSHWPAGQWLGWLAGLMVTVQMLSLTLDRGARCAIPLLSLLPLMLLLIGLDDRPRVDVEQAITLLFGGQILLSGLLLVTRSQWMPVLQRAGMKNVDPQLTLTARWMPIAAGLLTLLLQIPVFHLALSPEPVWQRSLPTMGILMAAPGLGLMARPLRTDRLRLHALLTLATGCLALVWAVHVPSAGAGAGQLTRLIDLLMVLAGLTAVLSMPVLRGLLARARMDLTPEGESAGSEWSAWASTVHRAAVVFGTGALAMLLAVLMDEALWFEPGSGAPVTMWQTGFVALTIAGLSAGLIALAVTPKSDPLGLNASGRQFYVYAAEVVAALLGLHIYLTMPELFTGALRRYWPLIVMGIAFAGAAAGEVLRRAQKTVLSDPLQRTAAFLPLIPALGFWIVTPRSSLATHYSTELFVAGLLYVFLAMRRKSLLYVVLAGLAGNAGLWAAWHELGLALTTRPQLWLIPPALSLLGAAQINRTRLKPEQLSAVRYFAVTLIYASSSGEMFLTGVGESLWLPLILMAFSVSGILAGILLRVRPFLYSGTGFLLLSVVSMVWHAAQNIGHVWPWWVFGIATGIGVLTLFGLFEKRRNDMLKVLGRLKSWE